MTIPDILQVVKPADVVALALFFRLGKIVADHEIRILTLEGRRRAGRPARRRPRR